MNTWKWSELTAEHVVGYTRNEIFLFMTMSMTLEVAEELYGLVVW
jgi:hypothetical protein